METPFQLEIIIALAKGERPTRRWWAARHTHGGIRAGGMPPETADPAVVTLRREVDPDTGDRYVRATFPLPPGTHPGRARELAHMLSSVLVAEGYTLRQDGKMVDVLPGVPERVPTGALGEMTYTGARVCSERCMDCVFASANRVGCCTQGSAFSLADIGSALLQGADDWVARFLSVPGEMDGEKWHPHLRGGVCTFHNPDGGCTLPVTCMPLQCRTYVCAPERLLPPDALADYEPFVDTLEEAEDFISDHMREVSGVDFSSPLEELRAAAAKAFAAWEAGVAQTEE